MASLSGSGVTPLVVTQESKFYELLKQSLQARCPSREQHLQSAVRNLCISSNCWIHTRCPY